jgi:hypothetical protein
MKSYYSKFPKPPWFIAALCSVLLALGGTGPAQAAATPIAKGSRVLGIDVNTAIDNNFVGAFTTAKGAGMQATSLVVYWDEMEMAPGVYQPTPNWLSIANIYYPSQNTQVLLTIVPIDTVRCRVPADLVGLRMDDPIVINRFNALLDYAFRQIPNLQLTALSIGNEVDIYLGANSARWLEFRRFFAATSAHARALRPGLLVGVQTTHDGILGPGAAEIAALNQSSDVVLISYYPLNGDFTVKSPGVVRSDWDLVMNTYPRRLVMFAQLGYPTGLANNSSQAKQKTFVDNVFEAWDVYRDRVPMVMFNWLHDLPTTTSQSMNTYYGISDPRFDSFLRTLGLRTVLGWDKTAFAGFKKQARARGW